MQTVTLREILWKLRKFTGYVFTTRTN